MRSQRFLEAAALRREARCGTGGLGPGSVWRAKGAPELLLPGLRWYGKPAQPSLFRGLSPRPACAQRYRALAVPVWELSLPPAAFVALWYRDRTGYRALAVPAGEANPWCPCCVGPVPWYGTLKGTVNSCVAGDVTRCRRGKKKSLTCYDYQRLRNSSERYQGGPSGGWFVCTVLKPSSVALNRFSVRVIANVKTLVCRDFCYCGLWRQQLFN